GRLPAHATATSRNLKSEGPRCECPIDPYRIFSTERVGVTRERFFVEARRNRGGDAEARGRFLSQAGLVHSPDVIAIIGGFEKRGSANGQAAEDTFVVGAGLGGDDGLPLRDIRRFLDESEERSRAGVVHLELGRYILVMVENVVDAVDRQAINDIFCPTSARRGTESLFNRECINRAGNVMAGIEGNFEDLVREVTSSFSRPDDVPG